MSYLSDAEFARFNSKISTVITNGGCWEWTGYKNDAGYAGIVVNYIRWYVHRLAYTEAIGPIPEGLTIDHRCNNPSCVNPMHLQPETLGDNIRRRPSSNKTHCKHGHEFTPENTIRRSYDGCRACRTCQYEMHQNWLKKQYIAA